MDARSKLNKEDDDSSTKQILEYYRKFSQSRELPKYFSGTSIAYLPQIVDDDNEKPTKSVIKSPKIIITEDQKKCLNELEQDIELSPTGSVASNRKLEWDNLGDIGYNNVKMIHRSASLPILTHEKNSENGGINTSATNNNVKVVIFPYTSSSDEKSAQNTLGYSSSSPVINQEIVTSTGTATTNSADKKLTNSDSSNDKKIVDFKQSLDYLKKRIGLPDAHSTPKEPQSVECKETISDTPYLKKLEKPVKKLVQEVDQKNISPKTVNQQQTCKEVGTALNSKNKVVNLYLTKPLLLDCLPATNVKQLTIDRSTTKAPSDLSEFITVHKNTDTVKISNDSAKSTSSNTVASKCDSFEYVKNDRSHAENVPVAVENSPLQRQDQTKNDNVKSEETKNNSENSQDLRATDPRIVGNDIERSVYILQRLIQSKKYDSFTKKKYIKKILQKITESKYLEDSSTSSELFYPKADPSKILHEQLKHSSYKNEKSSSSYQSHEEKKSSPKKKKSEITDSDVSFSKDKNAKPTSKTENRQTFLTRTESKTSQKKKSITDNLPFKEPESKENKKTPFTVTKCQEIKSSDKSSPQSYQNWREPKTVSEKLFESNRRRVEGGDQLIQFADREREYQLNWIDREINHLGKLKCLLENPDKAPENIKKTRTTSVYMVAASNNTDIKRNYVIETQLDAGSSQQRNFRINGENYIVQDPNNPSSRHQRPITADIQVMSTDKTTNIKVTTFCNVCKRAPCVCVTEFLPGISNPSKVREHLNSKTKLCSCSCSCNTTSSSNSSSKGSKTICVICHKSPCICCTCREPHNVKTCSVCKLYSCMCFISPKGSEVPMDPYAGIFAPAKSKMCYKCGALPCMCKLTTSNFANIPVEQEICGKCGVSRCMCETSTSNLPRMFETLCSKCSVSPCTCSSTFTRKPACCVCHDSPCECGKSTRILEDKSCCICGVAPCICGLPTNISARKPGNVCCVCGFWPCICELTTNYSTRKSEKKIHCLCSVIPCVCGSSFSKPTVGPEKETCGKHGISPCISDLLTSGSNSERQDPGAHSARTSSLTKVFVDCKCGASRACSCEFVDKLLKHFTKEDSELKKSKDLETTALQTVATPTTNEHVQTTEKVDGCTQRQISVHSRTIQTEVIHSIDKNVQSKIASSSILSQTDKRVASCATVETEQVCVDEIVQAGCQRSATTTVREHVASADKGVGAGRESRKSSVAFAEVNALMQQAGVQSGICALEKATSPREVPLTADKCIGRTVEECETQCSLTTAEKGISSRVLVDRGTSPCSFDADKRLGAANYSRSLIEQAASPDDSEVERKTNLPLRKPAIDNSTSSTIEIGTYTTRKVSVDKPSVLIDVDKCVTAKLGTEDADTSSISSRKSLRRKSIIGKDTGDDVSSCTCKMSKIRTTALLKMPLSSEKTTITSSEVAVGPDYKIDATPAEIAFDSRIPMTSRFAKCAPVYRGTESSYRPSNEDTVYDQIHKERSTSYRPKLTAVIPEMYEEGTKSKTIPISEGTMVKPEESDKSTVYNAEESSPIRPSEVKRIACTKLKSASTNVQTELRSKDIPYVGNHVCVCSPESSWRTSRNEKCICCGGDERKCATCKNELSEKKCSCFEKKSESKNHVICICSPVEYSRKSNKTKVICLNDLCKKKSHLHRSTNCKKCRVKSRSKSSDSKDVCRCRYRCNLEKTVLCRCCQKEIKNSETSTSTSLKRKSLSIDVSPTESLLTNSSSDVTCCCCGNQVPLDGISLLRSNDEEFPVCKECLEKRPVLTTVCFAGPENEESSGTSSRSKTTSNYFRRENYCTCKRIQTRKSFDYCPHCRNKLKKTLKSRNGIAYTLTLEDETPQQSRIRIKKKFKRLEEIKVKVPNPYNRKQHKNRENHHRKDEERAKRLKSGENSETEENHNSTNNHNNTKIEDDSETMNNKQDSDEYYSLQEYLQKNRPGFVDAAEYRRLAVINNKIERELNKDDRKLKFLEQNVHNNRLKRERLFTEQEMREINKRNYKKLPEVQQKLIDQRERKLRSADKFMADKLKRKIQNCVLQGKSSFPIDTNVINVYK